MLVDPTAGITGAGPVEPSLSIYPNPFMDQTTIKFDLQSSQLVKLAVYDLSGKEVRVLTNVNLAKGNHEFTWNGRNEFGQSLPQGVYLVKMEGGGKVLSGKVVLGRQ